MKLLETLMKKYDEAEKVVNTNLEAWPRNTLPAMQMRQRECKEEMKDLKSKYAEAIKAGSVVLCLTGSEENVEQFATVAETEAGTINIKANALYRRLAAFISPSMGDRRSFGVSQLGLLIRGLINEGRELGATNLPTPEINDVYQFATDDDLTNYVRTIVRKALGDQLNKLAVERDVFNQALEIRYTQSVVPVILTGFAAEEVGALDKALLVGTSFVIDTDTTGVSVEQVLQVLSDIRKTLKSKSN